VTSRHFAIRAGRSLKETARELDAEIAAELLTPQEVSAMQVFDRVLDRITRPPERERG